jgi:rare lipoprotein A
MSKMKTLLITGTLVVTAAVTAASGFNPKSKVTIFTDNGFIEVKTDKTSVEEILMEANITLSNTQKVYPAKEDDIMTNFITIKEGAKVLLKVDGEEYKLLSWADTIEELLEENQIELGETDLVNLPLQQKLKTGQEIQIIRVASEIVTEKVSIPAYNYYYYDPRLPLGSHRVYKQSRDGLKEITYKVTYNDGEEVSRIKLDEKVISNPQPGIVYQNTRELASRSSREYAVVGVASWYGDKFHGNRTASGEVYDKNKLTAAHRTLPFGTLVEVTFLRTGRSVVVRINDRGPSVEGRVIDLSEAAAREIGLRPYGVGDVRVRVIGVSR